MHFCSLSDIHAWGEPQYFAILLIRITNTDLYAND